MAPVNRRQIGDARQKIECSKIAKKVALKVARSRGRRQTSDQILKWILPEQNRQQQQQRRSRPRPQLLPNKFRNGSVNNALRMTSEFSSPSSRTSAIRKTLARIEHNINRNQAILSVRRQGFRNGRENVRSRLSRTLESRLEMDEEDASPSFPSKKLDLIRRTPYISYENAEDNDLHLFIAKRNIPTVGQSSSAASVFSRLSNINPPHQDIGFKVNVFNLNNTVSDEDIKELFSSIGPLLSSRLVRAGEACAIFESLADAKRAIAEFNNRELDAIRNLRNYDLDIFLGVPMKLSLPVDGKRDAPKTSTMAAPSIKSSTKTFNDSSAAAYSPLRSMQLLTKNAGVRRQPENRNDEDEDMEVDRDLITKALFNSNNKDNVSTGKNAKNEQSVQFTVKI